MTAVDLGMLTLTSKSTVFRFCEKVGVSSFEEFKHILSQELIEKEKVKDICLSESFNPNSQVSDVLGKMPLFYHSTISNTNALFDRKQIQKIVSKLKCVDVIDFYCSGITQSIAELAAIKFQTLGKQCNIFTNVNEHYVMSTKNTKRISIILSFTGANSSALSCAKKLKVIHEYMIGIGGQGSNKLNDYCTEYITIYDKENVYSLEMMNVSISMSYILDVLFVSLMVKDYKQHLDHSIEVENTFYKAE